MLASIKTREKELDTNLETSKNELKTVATNV